MDQWVIKIKKFVFRQIVFFMVSCWELESQTLWLKVKCSTCWANRTKYKIGCLGRIRTAEMSESKSDALPLGYKAIKMVEGHRFELWNPKEQIYSLPRLTTSLSFHHMVPTERIELPTYWLQVSCATYYAMSAKNGGRCRTRTYDPLLVRQVL